MHIIVNLKRLNINLVYYFVFYRFLNDTETINKYVLGLILYFSFYFAFNRISTFNLIHDLLFYLLFRSIWFIIPYLYLIIFYRDIEHEQGLKSHFTFDPDYILQAFHGCNNVFWNVFSSYFIFNLNIKKSISQDISLDYYSCLIVIVMLVVKRSSFHQTKKKIRIILTLLILSYVEEIIFRHYLVNVLLQFFNIYYTKILSSLLFAFIHLFNYKYHYDVYSTIYQVIICYFLGQIFFEFHNFLLCWMSHWIYNCFVFFYLKK